jgi:hypothetical protein
MEPENDDDDDGRVMTFALKCLHAESFPVSSGFARYLSHPALKERARRRQDATENCYLELKHNDYVGTGPSARKTIFRMKIKRLL